MYLPPIQDSSRSLRQQISRLMKIALYIKPWTTKAILCFLVVLPVFTANTAHAGFFSDLVTKVLGTTTQAYEIPAPTDTVIHNSQTVPLLESSLNPDLMQTNDVKESSQVSIVENEALSSNASPLGTDTDLEKYASSAKIDTYIVKKGDTLESITKKLKITKNTLLASNADLKRADLLKVGQLLVILPTEEHENKADVLPKKSTPKQIVTEPKPLPVVVKEEVVQTPVSVPPPVAQSVSQPIVEAPQNNTPPVTPTTTPPVSEVSGQPKGTIDGGYIWPFPSGLGRISQGLHGDNAFDFAAPKDTPILAIQSGTVFLVHPSGYNGGFGKYVVINFDDGRQAIFGHMNKTNVEAGQVVKQGDVIGYVGTTGSSTGYHTHIGIHGGFKNPYLGLAVGSTSIDHD